jgi:hypothetical protein
VINHFSVILHSSQLQYFYSVSTLATSFRKDGWMDGWMDGQTDGWMDG